MYVLKVRATFVEPLLATRPANDKLHEDFVAANAPDASSRAEEIAAKGIAECVEQTMTVFPQENGVPFMWDYQWKGYFKSVASAFAREREKYLPAFRKIIDLSIFVRPRRVTLILPAGGVIGDMQRPLRGQTAQGERIAIAHSQTVPAGTTAEFEVHLLDEKRERFVREWLDYGVYHGTGQWRNAGWGRFEWEEVK